MRKNRFRDYDDEPTVDLDDPVALTSVSPAPQKKNSAPERQTERFQFTVKPSTKAALTKYASDHNVSMNTLVLNLIEEFLKREGYTNT